MEKIRVDPESAVGADGAVAGTTRRARAAAGRAGTPPVADPGRAGRAQPSEEREAAHQGRIAAAPAAPSAPPSPDAAGQRAAPQPDREPAGARPPSSSGCAARAFASIARGGSSTKGARGHATRGCGGRSFAGSIACRRPTAATSCASTSGASPTSTSTTRRWSRAPRASTPAGAIWLALSDGAEEPLDPATLTVDGDGVLRAWVRGGRLEARLATSAVAALGRAAHGDARRAPGVARWRGRRRRPHRRRRRPAA